MTTNAARTLYLGDAYAIREGKSADFVIVDVDDYYETLCNECCVLVSYRGGQVLADTRPAKTTLTF